MTTVKFVLEGDRICGFSVSGHSGYAKEGSDIVCAAVSASVQMLEIQIAQVIGEEKASFTEKGTEISYVIPDLSEKDLFAVNNMVGGFMRFMQSVSKHYEDYLTLKTEVFIFSVISLMSKR